MNKQICHKLLLISLIVSTIGFESCYRDKFDFSNLNDSAEFSPHIGLPVAYGELTLRNLVKERKDTIKYYHEDPDPDNDSMIKLIYTIDTISQYKASEFLKPPQIEPVSKTVQLGVLKIDDQNSDTSITFTNFVTDNCLASDVAYYSGLTESDAVSAKFGTQYPPYNFKKFGGIAWVYTLTGDVNMTLSNDFDVPLSCKVLLQTDLSLIGEGTQTIGTFDFTKTPIPAHTFATKTIPVNGFKISSIITYKYSDVLLGAKASGPVGMNKKLSMTLQLANLQVTAGKAAIPSQSLKKDTTIWFNLDTYKGKKLTQLDVYKGIMNFDITSKIPGLNITLTLPNVKKNGVKVTNTFNFTGAGKISKAWDLSGFSMDLSANPLQPYNSLRVDLHFGVNSGGQQVSFNQTNDFTVTISNKDSLEFEIVRGNLGQDTVDIGNKTFNFGIDEFLKNYFNGTVKFTEPKLSLNFTNSVGMSASTNLQLTGITKDGKTFSLYDNPVLFKTINAAPVAYDTVYPNINITKDNSHIVDLISFMPHTMQASGIIKTNLGVPSNYYDNFITRQSFISVQLNAELPLKLSMKDVVLRQDFPLTPSANSSIETLDKDDQFKIIFYAKNQFPVDVTVKLTLLDTTATNPILDTLDVTIIKAAPTTNGKVSRYTYTRYREEIVLSKDKNPNMVRNFLKANKLRFEAKLNTYDQKSITLYTYYSIAFQLGVDAKVKYKTKLGIKK